ncbi:unnamed protein product, partial [Notodromas monacha]
IHSTISQASADHFQQQQQQPPTSSPTFATVIKSSSSPKKNPPVLPSSSSSQTKNNNIQPRAVSESQHRLDLIKRIIERCSESDQVPCNQGVECSFKRSLPVEKVTVDRRLGDERAILPERERPSVADAAAVQG